MSEFVCLSSRLLALTLVALLRWGGDAGRPASDDEPTCAGASLAPVGAAALAGQAVEVLRQAGHDPRAYRLELRLEDTRHPDFPTLGSERVTSVLFVPAEGVEAYSLRVHPAHPCHVAWVWNPGSFTPWQRRVVERAMGQARETLPAGWPAEPQQVRVLESADHVGIQLFGVSDPDPIFSLTLRKHDLSTVQVGVVGSRKDW